MDCKECGGIMAKKETLHSGNSVFTKYMCKACGKTYTHCEGISK